MTSPHDEVFEDFEALVRTHGWAVRHVLGGPASAPVSYTAGLGAKGWPELVVAGLQPEIAQVFIWNAVDEQQERGPFRAGDRTHALTESGEILFLHVDDAAVMTATRRLFGDFDAIQLVWPDSGGHFPWEPGCRNGPDAQPLLGDPPSRAVRDEC